MIEESEFKLWWSRNGDGGVGDLTEELCDGSKNGE